MISVSLIGHGYWGKILEKYIRANEDFNLRYICDSKSDLNQVWDDESITAVIIAVRNEQKYPIVRKALLSGKHVFTEKPLALTTLEACDLVRIANDRSLKLAINYTFTFSKSIEEVTRLLNPEHETLLGMNMTVRHLGPFGGGNVYWILGSHMLSVLGMFKPLKSLEFYKQDIVEYNGSTETGLIIAKDPRGNFQAQINLSLNYLAKETEIVFYTDLKTMIYNPRRSISLLSEFYERTVWAKDTDIVRNGRRHYDYDEQNNVKYALEYFYQVLTNQSENNTEVALDITKILEEIRTR